MLDLQRQLTILETHARFVMVALIAADRPLFRDELHGIINQSRPSWPITNGELTDAVKFLRSRGKITITIREDCYIDAASTLHELVGG